jgi:diadenylate cyclase
LLHRVHKLSPELAQKIANQFGGLPRLQRVTVDELMAVDGVDSETAETVKDTLDRVTENTILDQYS